MLGVKGSLGTRVQLPCRMDRLGTQQQPSVQQVLQHNRLRGLNTHMSRLRSAARSWPPPGRPAGAGHTPRCCCCCCCCCWARPRALVRPCCCRLAQCQSGAAGPCEEESAHAFSAAHCLQMWAGLAVKCTNPADLTAPHATYRQAVPKQSSGAPHLYASGPATKSTSRSLSSRRCLSRSAMQPRTPTTGGGRRALRASAFKFLK